MSDLLKNNMLLHRITVKLTPEGLLTKIDVFKAQRCNKIIKYRNQLDSLKSLPIDDLGKVQTKLKNVIPGGMISFYAFAGDSDSIQSIQKEVKQAVVNRFEEISEQFESLQIALAKDIMHI
jgi:hypothetical protein